MNEKNNQRGSSRRPLIWGVAGIYLAYLGFDMLRSYFTGKTVTQGDILACTIGGGVFLVAGIFLVILAARHGMAAMKAQAAELDRLEAEEAAERLEAPENNEQDTQA